MSKITLTTLKKGAEGLGLSLEGLTTKKEIEAAIDSKISDQELDYECPECTKDIPDVDVCPYCNANFAEEDEDGTTTEEVSSEATDSEVEAQTEDASTDTEDEATEEQPTNDNTETDSGNSEVAEEPTLEETPVAEEKPKAPKKERLRNEDTEVAFNELQEAIDKIVGEEGTKNPRANGVTYMVGKKRFLKVVSSTRSLGIEFNVELGYDDENLKKFTPEEAKAKHLGTVRAIYTFGDIETALILVEEAWQTFNGLVTA